MEGDLTIEVDEEFYAFLRKRAEAKGISVDDEAREILVADSRAKSQTAEVLVEDDA